MIKNGQVSSGVLQGSSGQNSVVSMTKMPVRCKDTWYSSCRETTVKQQSRKLDPDAAYWGRGGGSGGPVVLICWYTAVCLGGEREYEVKFYFLGCREMKIFTLLLF